jgi:glycosyltransferase involved in cell wall biosynthesis
VGTPRAGRTAHVDARLGERDGVELALSFAENSDLAPELRAQRFPRLEVRTFDGGAASVLAATPRTPALLARTTRWLRKNRVEVVTTMIFHPWNVVWALAARRAGARFVPFIHDIDPHPGDELPLQRALTRAEVRLAHGVIALSDHVAARALEKHPRLEGRVTVVPLPPLTAAIGAPRSLPGDRPVRLLFLGRLREYKGLDLLAPMVEELRRRGSRVELRVAGDGELRAVLPEGTELTSRWLAPDEVDSFVDWADVLVAPYREASQSGVVPLAGAHGVPSVVTPVGGLREQVVDGEDGSVARAVDPTALADAFDRLVASYERYSAGALARANAGWGTTVDRVVEAWRAARA